jgi:hypothetical protein
MLQALNQRHGPAQVPASTISMSADKTQTAGQALHSRSSTGQPLQYTRSFSRLQKRSKQMQPNGITTSSCKTANCRVSLCWGHPMHTLPHTLQEQGQKQLLVTGSNSSNIRG